MLFRALVRLYGWSAPVNLVNALAGGDYRVVRYLGWFWRSKTFVAPRRQLTDRDQILVAAIGLGMLFQILLGLGFLVDWARYGSVGTWQFGAALLLAYPLIWAHVLAVLASIGWLVYFLLHPKKFGRAIVCSILEAQVQELLRRNKITVIAVVGSVGKTSTKLAIADLLSHSWQVIHQAGNYNDRVTVPLVFFGQREPSTFNIFGWLRVFGANQGTLAYPYPYDTVVVELGTDGPGQLKHFAYLKPDISVVTAVSPEHMEYFKTLDAVAAEELSVFSFSKRVLVNGDDIPGQYLAGREFTDYSLVSQAATYFAAGTRGDLGGQTLDITLPGGQHEVAVSYIGHQGAKFALAAAAVADMLGMPAEQIVAGLPKLKHFSGRMQVLPGVQNSTLIDDTYNASPMAVKAALDVLYTARTSQRIAILGSMNELGDYAREAHHEVGEYCDPKKLALVVTIGRDAKRWLAPAAKARGCTVKSCLSPYEAAAYVATHLREKAVVLAKGSQNGVFTEEALKPLLADPADAAKLVRQSPAWLKAKLRQFPH